MLIIIILLIAILLLLVIKTSWLRSAIPWLWGNIGKPIFNYYFSISFRKVTIYCLSLICFICLGWSGLKFNLNVCLSDESPNWSGFLEINYGTIDWLTIGLISLIVIFYIVFVVYERTGAVSTDSITSDVNDIKNITTETKERIISLQGSMAEIATTLNNRVINNSLRELYNCIIRASDSIDIFIIYVCNRGGVSYYTNKDVLISAFQPIYRLREYIEGNRIDYSIDFYTKLCEYVNLCVELKGECECLHMALYSADPDAITPVLDLNYERDIHCCKEFVSAMMTAFNEVDPNYIYTNFSKAYAKLDEMKNEVFDLMNAKRHNIL